MGLRLSDVCFMLLRPMAVPAKVWQKLQDTSMFATMLADSIETYDNGQDHASAAESTQAKQSVLAAESSGLELPPSSEHSSTLPSLEAPQITSVASELALSPIILC